MNRQHIVIGIVGVLVGFILGFFVAVGTQKAPSAGAMQQAAGGELPENHPSPEIMQWLEETIAVANAEPENAEVRVALGDQFYDMGRFDAAIPWYEAALALNPENLHASTDLGTCYLYTGDFEKAMDRYQKSLLIEPDHPQTLQNMGVAKFSEGDNQGAIDLWNRLLSVHPDYSRRDDVLQQIQSAQNHLDAAEAN
ncbi:MAG: tetratricopeptide repeat protein [Acidobacteriota bacterium]|nr:MAG: tetratricopeptide repeat protein [Acidobacteriota bacterium]